MIKSHWQQALDRTAENLIAQLELSHPPVDAIRAVKTLGIRLAYDHSQRSRGRRKTLAGQQAIFLKPKDRPERLQWAAAHELGEVFAFKVFEAADWTGTEIPTRLREQVANLFAARFLLPTTSFAGDCRATDFDLPRLKEIYSTASHELIARRMLDLRPDAILTIFDNDRCVGRFNGHDQRIATMLDSEKACWESATTTGVSQTCEVDGVSIHVWPIHEPGWKRELMLTFPSVDWHDEAAAEHGYSEAVG